MWDLTACWEFTTLAPRISASAGGASPGIPTPTATDARSRAYQVVDGRRVPTLVGYARLWPTPTVSDVSKGCNVPDGKRGAALIDAIRHSEKWPTPTASMMTSGDLEQARFSGSDPRRPDYANANQVFPTPLASDATGGYSSKKPASRKGTAGLKETIPGGPLNPTWVEWLMAWPLGWSALGAYPSSPRRKERQPAGNTDLQRSEMGKSRSKQRLPGASSEGRSS